MNQDYIKEQNACLQRACLNNDIRLVKDILTGVAKHGVKTEILNYVQEMVYRKEDGIEEIECSNALAAALFAKSDNNDIGYGIVSHLLEVGADIHASLFGENVLDRAIASKNYGDVSLLVAYGAVASKPQDLRDPILDKAILRGAEGKKLILGQNQQNAQALYEAMAQLDSKNTPEDKLEEIAAPEFFEIFSALPAALQANVIRLYEGAEEDLKAPKKEKIKYEIMFNNQSNMQIHNKLKELGCFDSSTKSQGGKRDREKSFELAQSTDRKTYRQFAKELLIKNNMAFTAQAKAPRTYTVGASKNSQLNFFDAKIGTENKKPVENSPSLGQG